MVSFLNFYPEDSKMKFKYKQNYLEYIKKKNLNSIHDLLNNLLFDGDGWTSYLNTQLDNI